MATFKEKLKFVSAYVWSLFKASVLPSIMYFCASAILMMLVIKGEKIDWTSTDITWTVVCILGAAAYNRRNTVLNLRFRCSYVPSRYAPFRNPRLPCLARFSTAF